MAAPELARTEHQTFMDDLRSRHVVDGTLTPEGELLCAIFGYRVGLSGGLYFERYDYAKRPAEYLFSLYVGQVF